ncbi:MAG TPA: carbamoyltransferase HypF [Anaerolineales bacterium]|nr:carbamoyltransferase HypF [Anaerolineales bacterium]
MAGEGTVGIGRQGVRLHITGVVQGVGFRPFIYSLANRFSVNGWVRNTSAGVDIEVEGTPLALEAFITAIRTEAPPLSRIDEVTQTPIPSNGFTQFEILHSASIPDAFQPISPDVSICDDCLRELFDPLDRRFHYPFINCTNCGPRFTIIEDIPYDRPKTTMVGFPMCPDCLREYQDPSDRRFHAQPVACPVCGPSVWLEFSPSINSEDSQDVTLSPAGGSLDAIRQSQHLLSMGKIIAVKGLGGFHLACDATNPQAVARLRQRKLRVDKPFALMMSDLETIQSHCVVSDVEQVLLISRERPIVILEKQPGSSLPPELAPGQHTLGVMLPYTPLHYLLFADLQDPQISARKAVLAPPKILVMTSGNLSEEPIAIDNAEARSRLAGLADAFLMHNRPIRTRCDDSVLRAAGPVRRSRGYAPFPVHLSWKSPPLVAVGAELKNTFCLTRDRYAFLSHHIGDLENYETLQSFEDGIAHFERLFRIRPEALGYDLHPDYLSTRYAIERSEREKIPSFPTQHHHAHIAACMAENSHPGDRPVLGVSLDGTGFGADGAIWGGEFLIADYQGYQRFAHLSYVPLPGGDRAVREPWRMALTWLAFAGIPWDEDLPPVRFAQTKGHRLADQEIDPLQALSHQLQTGLNAPLTSSFGRLFDAVASLIGVRFEVNYEAQAAIELEALADPPEPGEYHFVILSPDSAHPHHRIDPTPALHEVVADFRIGTSPAKISARFHRGVAQAVVGILMAMRNTSGLNQVALSGGVWQNQLLLNSTLAYLSDQDFEVILHTQVPCNDGGISLGQAAIASWRLTRGLE